ncbi:peptide ABC transporter substrate-binding protein [Aerophototrophica crusticola]
MGARFRTVDGGPAPAPSSWAPALVPTMRTAPSVPRLLAFLAFLVLCLVPPGTGQTARTVDRGSVLHISVGREPDLLDPHRATSPTADRVLGDLYEGLLAWDAGGNLVAGAAETWSTSEDGLTWTFQLRAAGKWSDGSPVTAEDFVYGLRRALAQPIRPFSPDLLFPIRNARQVFRGDLPPSALGVRAVDRLVLEITLDQPAPTLSVVLAGRTAYPIHKASLQAEGVRAFQAGKLVGNGPFMLVETVPGTSHRLVRNPHFHAARDVALDGVVMHLVEDPQAELREFRAGTLHVTSTLPTGHTTWVQRQLADSLRIVPRAQTMSLVFNQTLAPWKDDTRLREALSLAIDREALAADAGEGARPAETLIPPGLDGYQPPPGPWAGLDRAAREAKARELYAAAGYGPDKPLTVHLLYPSGESNKAVVVAISRRWRELLGVRTRLENDEARDVVERLRRRDFQDILLRIQSTPQLARFLEPFRPGALDSAGYGGKPFAELLKRANDAPDMPGHLAGLRAAEARLLADMAVVPVLYPASRRLVAPTVRGWQDNLRDIHPSRYLSLAPETVADRKER